MAKQTRWLDGRSGESGRVAGNLVLDHLDATGNRIRNLKGTVFNDSRTCWIGRVVADDSYLSNGVAHWANISADQQRQLAEQAAKAKQKLMYLFITAHAQDRIIRYWQVPAEALERELIRRKRNGSGEVLGLHISIRDGRYLLGEEDVTDCVSEFAVDANDSDELKSAVKADQARKKRPSPVSLKPIQNPTSETVRRFDIPISDGRVVTLHAPIPMERADVERIKSYIDVITDLLL